MNIRTVIKYAAVAAALAMATPAMAQSSFKDLADMASAAMDAARERSDQAAALGAVKAIFAKAEEAAEDGAINFCGFYLGMSEDEAKTLAAHYGLKEDQWKCLATPASEQVYRLTFTLRGIRRVTKGGNTFDELSQAVANRIGTMKSKRDNDYNLVGYEYRNIDGQTAFMSEGKGLVLEDSAEHAEAVRKAAAEAERKPVSEAERKAIAEASKGPLAKLGSDMVPIPGYLQKDSSICKYEVTQALWKYEVTQALWFAVMGENPSKFKGADRPVEQVSWNDCQTFLEKLNALPEVKASGKTYRLPTADEWEFACRAGATGDYCRLADDTEISKATLGEMAWYDDNSEIGGDKQTHPVGQKKPNAFGLYDMHGNAWEWTSTAVGRARVYCGGSWDCSAYGCEAGSRNWDYPDYRNINLGLRLAR